MPLKQGSGVLHRARGGLLPRPPAATRPPLRQPAGHLQKDRDLAQRNPACQQKLLCCPHAGCTPCLYGCPHLQTARPRCCNRRHQITREPLLPSSALQPHDLRARWCDRQPPASHSCQPPQHPTAGSAPGPLAPPAPRAAARWRRSPAHAPGLPAPMRRWPQPTPPHDTLQPGSVRRLWRSTEVTAPLQPQRRAVVAEKGSMKTQAHSLPRPGRSPQAVLQQLQARARRRQPGDGRSPSPALPRPLLRVPGRAAARRAGASRHWLPG